MIFQPEDNPRLSLNKSRGWAFVGHVIPALMLTLIAGHEWSPAVLAGEQIIPAYTAYADSDNRDELEGMHWRQRTRFDEKEGITYWRADKEFISWFGRFASRGRVECAIEFTPMTDDGQSLAMKIGDQMRRVEIPAGSKQKKIRIPFGDFSIADAGYVEFRLQSVESASPVAFPGQVHNLILSSTGEVDVLEGVHFNMKPRRNAASVHLSYPVTDGESVTAFYCEMTGLEDPVWTYYMACGWHRGYFGMQVNSRTERRIIFSVWDSGDEAVDRKKVSDDNRVLLVGKGPEVHTNDFGNEGTGGHSHLKYLWKTGAVQKFLVTAQPIDGKRTIYSGYYFHPDESKWMLISSWNAPKDGGTLGGLYSFSENFVGDNGHLVRKARFGNQWIYAEPGGWKELTTARFSHDPTGKSDRMDRYMGIEDGQFFLSHGGFLPGFTEFRTPFSRPAQDIHPEIPIPFFQ